MSRNKTIDLISVLIFIAPLLMGCLDLWAISILAISCIIGIIIKAKQNKKIILPKDFKFVLLCIYVFSFLVVQFYAVDKGMNLIGFFKSFTIIIFILLCMQYDERTKQKAIQKIPCSALTSLILSVCFLGVGNVFLNNRLHGIFLYANAYALFLILGIIILLLKDEVKIKDFIIALILFIGVIFTNSRAVIILGVLSILFCGIYNKKSRKKVLFATVILAVVLILIYTFSGIEKRISLDMFKSGEVTLRVVYYKDALKMIAENPFGYGSYGYMYKQADIQTTTYDTMYVHSSILQVILDVGIIPMIALLLLLIIIFFEKKQSVLNRMLLFLIVGHSLIDIDMEYMFFVYLISMMIEFKSFEFKKSKVINVVCWVILISYIFLFVGGLAFRTKDYELAYVTVPFYTKAMEEELYTTKSYDKQIEMAKKIYPLNKNISGVYEALSNEAKNDENYEKALEYEKARLILNKFYMEDYLLYLDFLEESYEYNIEKNDVENAEKYKKEILNLENTFYEYTKESPTKVEFPNEIKEYIKKYQ